ncbi:MAG: T9SS type A sorting domain-containing protein [Bacteroidota bacterium]
MKKLLPVLFLFFTLASSGQWTSTSSYYDGTTFALFSSPQAIGLVTNTGLSMLKSSGPGWHPLMTATWFSTPMVALTDRLIMIADGSYYTISHDGGASWQQQTGPSAPQFMGIMGQTLLVIDQDKFVRYSTDLGNTWQQSPSGLDANYGITATIMGNEIYALQNSGNSSDNLYRCSYDGTVFTAWTLVKAFPQFQDHYTLKAFKGVLYMGTDSGVKRSMDQGVSWGYVSDVQENVAFIEIDSTYLYSTDLSMYGLKRYNFQTSLWTTILQPFVDTALTAMAACNGQFYACLSNHFGQNLGLFRYRDNKWQSAAALPVGASATSVNHVKYAGTGLFTAATGMATLTGANVYSSADRGASWLRYETTSSWSLNDAFLSGSKYLVAGNNGVGIADPANGTITLSSGINGYEAFTFEKFGSLLYAGTADGIYTSSNDGQNWGYKFLKGKIVYKLKVANNILYGGTDQGLFSTSDGITWSNTTCLVPDIRDIAASTTDIFVTSSSGLLKKVDSLNAWIPVGTALVGIDVTAIVARSVRLFAGTAHGTVLYTDDAGTTWMDISSAGFQDITGFDFAGGSLFASEKSSGIWEYPAGWPSGIEPAPVKSSLAIFPNPASDVITIRFPRLLKGTTTVEIENITGIPVRSDLRQAVSNGMARLNVAGLPAGIYFVVVRSNDLEFIGKFIKTD